MKRLAVIIFVCIIALAISFVSATGTIDANTVAVLHFNQTVDDYTNQKVWTNFSTISNTSGMKFGSGNQYFDGSGTAVVSTPKSDINPSLNNNFTIDVWVKRDTADIGTASRMLGTGAADGTPSVTYGWDATNHFEAYVNIGGFIAITSANTTTDTSSWHHYAFVRNSSMFILYWDGVEQKSYVNAGAITNTGTNFTLGRQGEYAGAAFAYTGKMDEFRYSNVSRWNASFTPPTSEYSYSSGGTTTTLSSSFSANTTGGMTPIDAAFTDTSLGTPTTFNWTFREVTGNNTPIIFSALQNPIKTFGTVGNYFISLNVTNSTGAFNISTQNTWINVTPRVYSGFTRQDLVMTPRFTFTLNIVDSATSMPIPVVGVLDSLGNNQTTSTGTFVESYPYSAVILYITSTGYTGRTVSYIIDSDRTETVEMSEAVEIPVVQPQSYPKYVTFHIKDGSMFGAPLTEVGINVTGISTSSGDWDWVSQLIGLPLNEVPINTAPMYQSTDSLGRATFYVIPTAKYNITFTKAGYTIPPMILVPQDDDYIVTATSATSPFYRNGVDEISAINISVSSTLYNESWAFLNFTYYDSTGHTTGGTVRVLQKSDTAWTADSVMATWPVTSSSFSNSTVVVHVQQVSGYIDANITHSDFGAIQRSYPYAFNSVPVQFLGFEQDITLIVALGIMLFTMMLGGAAHGRILLVVVTIEGWIMYTMHWFQSLFDRGVPETAFIAALVFMFIIGILANILMRKKRGL